MYLRLCSLPKRSCGAGDRVGCDRTHLTDPWDTWMPCSDVLNALIGQRRSVSLSGGWNLGRPSVAFWCTNNLDFKQSRVTIPARECGRLNTLHPTETDTPRGSYNVKESKRRYLEMMAVIDWGQVYRWVVTRCVHATHVHWVTGKLIWVWLLCSPEHLALAHTHRNTKEHEAKICSPRLRMQMKTCSYGIQHNTPPSTLQICVTCIACATCWMRAGTRGLLGSPFKQIKNSQGCCRGSPEHFTTDAHDGKRAFFLHCAPLFFITSEVHKHNTTSPREQREPWNKVIDFQESSTLWLVCVCVYTAAAAFHV